jgi:zinc transporter ZupT
VLFIDVFTTTRAYLICFYFFFLYFFANTNSHIYLLLLFLRAFTSDVMDHNSSINSNQSILIFVYFRQLTRTSVTDMIRRRTRITREQ